MPADLSLSVGLDFTELDQGVRAGRQRLEELNRSQANLAITSRRLSSELSQNERVIANNARTLEQLSKHGDGAAQAMTELSEENKRLTQNSINLQRQLQQVRDQMSQNRREISQGEGPATSLGRVYEQLGEQFSAARSRFRLLSRVLAGAGVFGLTVTVGQQVVKLFTDWIGVTGEVAERHAQLKENVDNAIQSVSKEAAEVGLLVNALSSSTASHDQIIAAQKRLSDIAPDVFNGLDIERQGVEALNTAYDKYLNSLVKRAQIQAQQAGFQQNIEREAKIRTDLDKAQKRLNKAQSDYNDLLNAGFTGDALALGMQGIQNAENQINSLNRQLSRIHDENQSLFGDLGTAKTTQDVQDFVNQTRGSLQRLRRLSVELNIDNADEQIKVLRDAITKLVGDFGIAADSGTVVQFTTQLASLGGSMETVTDKTDKTTTAVTASVKTIQDVLNELNRSLSTSNQFADLFDVDNIQNQINTIQNAIKNLIENFGIANDNKIVIDLVAQVRKLELDKSIADLVKSMSFKPEEVDIPVDMNFKPTETNQPTIKMSEIQRQRMRDALIGAGITETTRGHDITPFSATGIDELLETYQDATERIKRNAADVADTITPMFRGLFDTILDGGNVFESLSRSLKNIISDLATAAIRALVFKNILKFSPLGFLPFSSGGMVTAASGGYISGPGSGTSDSIPARLSNGEYVIRSAVVQKIGKGFFDMINGSPRLPINNHFQTGGLVSSDSISNGINVSGEFRIRGTDLIAAVSRGTLQKTRLT